MIRNWLIRKLGGVPKETFDRAIYLWNQDVETIERAVEIHNLQGAIQEAKLERKRRRVH